MSWAAFEKNCLNCEYHRLLKAGKLDFNARPCPEDTRRNYKGKRISPETVLGRMRSDWRCPAREALKGGER
jgi:hypothetical protein